MKTFSTFYCHNTDFDAMNRLGLRVVKYQKFIVAICLCILAVFTFRRFVDVWHSGSISLHHVTTSSINGHYWQYQSHVLVQSLKNTQDSPAILLQNSTATGGSLNCHCTGPGHGGTASYDLILYPSNISSNASHNSEPTGNFSLHLSTTNTPVKCNNPPAPSSESDHATSESEEYESNEERSSDVFSTTSTEKKDYLLFVAILSQYNDYYSRLVIRKTWMKLQKPDSKDSPILVKFVIGTMNLSTAAVENLTAEENVNHDLLLLPHLVDNRNNLTQKVLYTLVWADENVNFSYLLKCDTDTFVRLDSLAKELSKRKTTKNFYWGYFAGSNKPTMQGKWPEHKWFLCDYYLPYAVGGGYVISSNLVHRLAVNSDGLQLYVCEDVSVGVWLSPFTIERKHDVRFNTGHRSRGCSNEYLIFHKQSPEDMHQLYSNLLKTGRQCESENSLFHYAYVYNWHTQPSKCCIRRTRRHPYAF